VTRTTCRKRFVSIALTLTVAAGFATTASAAAKTLVLYSGYNDADSSSVTVFDAFAGTPLGEIASVPSTTGVYSALAVDGAGNVYVTELSVRPTISVLIYEYAPNATAPNFTYDVPSGYQPLLAVNAAGDLATVAGAHTFVFCTHGNREPIRTVSGPDFLQAPVVASDGTAWAMPFDLHSRTVTTVAPGATSVTTVHLAGRFAPTGGAIALDGRGDLLVMEGPVVTVFDGATGNVRASVPIAGTFDGYPAMELAPDEKHLFVGTRHGTIAIYAWPAGGLPVKTYVIPGNGSFALGYR